MTSFRPLAARKRNASVSPGMICPLSTTGTSSAVAAASCRAFGSCSQTSGSSPTSKRSGSVSPCGVVSRSSRSPSAASGAICMSTSTHSAIWALGCCLGSNSIERRSFNSRRLFLSRSRSHGWSGRAGNSSSSAAGLSSLRGAAGAAFPLTSAHRCLICTLRCIATSLSCFLLRGLTYSMTEACTPSPVTYAPVAPWRF